MTDLNKIIATLIWEAQEASMEAKETWDYDDRQEYYNKKTDRIAKAIRLIQKSKSDIFRFSIVNKPDQNGYDSCIVYFTAKIEGERLQVSFHGFNYYLWDYAKTSKPTRWVRRKSSGQSAYEIAQFYDVL